MVVGVRKDDYLVEVVAGSFQIVSDVKPDLGGKDLGPNPHELLEAALVSCTVMTMQMYANRKGWPLESSEVKVTIAKEGAESLFNREIKLNGPLSEEQKMKLLEIADKCPIHKILMSQVSIDSKLIS